jgi:hypothetical protein
MAPPRRWRAPRRALVAAAASCALVLPLLLLVASASASSASSSAPTALPTAFGAAKPALAAKPAQATKAAPLPAKPVAAKPEGWAPAAQAVVAPAAKAKAAAAPAFAPAKPADPPAAAAKASATAAKPASTATPQPQKPPLRPPSINGYTPLWIKDEETAAFAAKKLQAAAAGPAGSGKAGGGSPLPSGAALLKAFAKRATGNEDEADSDADYAGDLGGGKSGGGLLSLLQPLKAERGDNLRTAAPSAEVALTAADAAASTPPGAAAVAKGLASVLGLPTQLPDASALPSLTMPAAKEAAKQALAGVLANVDLSKVDLNDVQGSLERLSGGVLSGLDAALAGAGQSATDYVSQLSSNMKPPKLAISRVEATRFAVYGWEVEQALAGVVNGGGGLSKKASAASSAAAAAAARTTPKVAAAMVAEEMGEESMMVAAVEGGTPEGMWEEWEVVEEEGEGALFLGGEEGADAEAEGSAGGLGFTTTTMAVIDGAGGAVAGDGKSSSNSAATSTPTSTTSYSSLREDATSAETVFDSAAVVGRKVVVSRTERRSWWRVRGTVTLSNVNIVPLVVSGLAVTVAAGGDLGDAAPPATLAASAALGGALGGARGGARVARVAASCPSASEKSDAVLIPGTALSSLMPGKLECTFEATLPGDTPADAKGKITAALNVALLPALSGQAAPAVSFSLANAPVEERGACATVTDTYYADADAAARALAGSGAGGGAAGGGAAAMLGQQPQLPPTSVAAGDKPPSDGDVRAGKAAPLRVCGPEPTTFMYAAAYGPYDNAACGSYGSTNVVRVVPEGLGAAAAAAAGGGGAGGAGGAGGGGGLAGAVAGLLEGLGGGGATAAASDEPPPSSSSSSATNPLASGLAGLLGLATAQGVGGSGSAKEGGGEFVGGVGGGAFGAGPLSRPAGGVSSATLPLSVTGCLPVTVVSATPRTIRKYSWDVQQQAAALLGSGGHSFLFGGLGSGGGGGSGGSSPSAAAAAPAAAFWTAPGISLPLGYTVRFTRAADVRYVLTGTVVLSNPTARPLTAKAATVTAGGAAAAAAAAAGNASAETDAAVPSGGRTAADLLTGCARAAAGGEGQDATSSLVVVPPASADGTPGTVSCAFQLELPAGGRGDVEATVEYSADTDPLGARAEGARVGKPLAYDFAGSTSSVIEIGKCADVRVAFDKGYGAGESSSSLLVAPRALFGALPPGLSSAASASAEQQASSSSSSSRASRVCAPTSYSFRATFSPLPGGCGSARAARMVATAAPVVGGAGGNGGGGAALGPAASKAAALAAAKQAVRRALPIGVAVAGGDCGPVVPSAAASAADNAAATVAAIGRRVVVGKKPPSLPTAVDPLSGLRLAAGSPLAQAARAAAEAEDDARAEEEMLLARMLLAEQGGAGGEEEEVGFFEEEMMSGAEEGGVGSVAGEAVLFAAEVEGPTPAAADEQPGPAFATAAAPVTVSIASLTPGVVAAAYQWTVEAGTLGGAGSGISNGSGNGGELSVAPGGSAALTRAVVVRRSEQAEAVSPTGAAGYSLSGVVVVDNPSLSPLPPLKRVFVRVLRPGPGGPGSGRGLRALEVPTTCSPGTVVPAGQSLECSFALAYPDTVASRAVATAEFLTAAAAAGAASAALPGATVVPAAVRSAPAKFSFDGRSDGAASSLPLRAVIAGECASLTDDLDLAAPPGFAVGGGSGSASSSGHLLTVLDDGQGVAAVKAPSAAAVASGAAAPLRLCGGGDRRFRYQVLLGPLGGAGRCFGVVGDGAGEETEAAYVLRGEAVASPLVAGAAAAVPSAALRSTVASPGRGQTAAVSAESELVVRLAGC